MARLFVSYRRADRPDTVKLLADRLRARLPRWQVFYDHESIAPGEEFPRRLAEEVASATVVLVVIGPKWLEELRGRSADAVDHVRDEVRLALASTATLVPVTVQNAPLPSEADLALFGLSSLAVLNARAVRPDPDFDRDIDRLVAFLEPLGPSVDVGTVLAGKYKLTQALGEGGMGVVYRAEQQEPKRTVAVKLIKPGMDSKEVLARFETERQALAVMDHPNIARVIDAGTTPAGRPFFVMDFVRGVAVTDYCDDRKLPLADRLALFCQVCDAVQHAHQKGIIHRDLKPSNVLVEVIDGRAVPKVIDFGLAKAMSHRLTDRSFVSELGKTVGTLPYSSPEQAAGKTFEVDTRTDIYSLGALLYEILAGTPPFTAEELKAAGDEAMARMIRETEPPTPSSKAGSSASLPTLAANRVIEPARLARQLAGELDWIVMKALDKEPGRRYATAASFADDVQHFLRSEPVSAGKPSRARRLRKFARRNRAAVTAVAAVFGVLLLGVVGTSLGFLKAREQTSKAVDAAGKEKEAKELAERRFAQLDQANTVIAGLAVVQDPFLPAYAQLPTDVAMSRKLAEVALKIDELAGGDALIRAKLQLAVGTAQVGVGEGAPAIELLEQARATFAAEGGPDDPSAMDAAFQSAMALALLNRNPEALAILVPLRPRFERRFGEAGEMCENLRYILGMVLVADGKATEGVAHVEAIIARRSAAKNPNDIRLIAYRFMLVSLYERVGDREKKTAVIREIMATRSDAFAKLDQTGLMGQGMNKLADALKHDDEKVTVEGIQAMYADSRRRVGIYHPSTCAAGIALLQLHCLLDQAQAAISFGEELNRTLLERYGDKHFLTLVCRTYLAVAYVKDRKLPRALELIEPSQAALVELFGADSAIAIDAYCVHAACLAGQRNVRGAIDLVRKASDLSVKMFGGGSPQAMACRDDLADLLQRDKQWDAAVQVAEAILADCREKHGPDALVTLRYQLGLAERLQTNQKSERAAGLFEDCLAKVVRRHGEKHAATTTVLNACNRFYLRQGAKADGREIELLRTAVKSRTAALGTDHAAVEAIRRRLANALLQSPATEAEGTKAMTELIEARLGRSPKGDVEAGKMLEELAYFHMNKASTSTTPLPERKRRAVLALKYFDESLAQPAPITKYGPDRSSTLNSMGRLEMLAGNSEGAIKRYEACLADLRAEKAADRDDALRVHAAGELRELYRKAGKFDLALARAAEAHEAGKSGESPSALDAVVRHAELVLAHLEAGKPEEAAKVADELTEQKLRVLPATYFHRPRVHWYLALAYASVRKHEKARGLYRDVMEQLEKGQFNHRDAVPIVRDFIDCLQRLKNHDEAESWQRKLVAQARRRDGTHSATHAQELATLGLYQVGWKKWADAELVLTESLSIRERLIADPQSGVQPWQVANVKSLLGEALFRQDKPGEKRIVEGCDELFRHADSIPEDARVRRMQEASARLVRFHLAGKRTADALQTAERFAAWAEASKVDQDLARYNATCQYALCIDKEKPDATTLGKCIALLTKCRDSGFFKEAEVVKHFEGDNDFKHLRDHPDFVAFAKTLKR